MVKVKNQAKGWDYNLFILFLILFGAVAPILYILFVPYLDSYYFVIDLVSPESFHQGHWYTLCATVFMIHASYLFRPAMTCEMGKNRYESVSINLRKIIFFTAILALGIGILLDLLYGRSPSNLTSQRPEVAVYLGYLSRLFSQSAALTILFPLLAFKRLDKYAITVIFLIFIQSITSWSRSGIFDILFIILLGVAYSGVAKQILILQKKKLITIVVGGVIAAIIGDINRGAPPFQVFSELLFRFYANNQALYLAIENPDKIYEILTYNEPDVLLQQLFSFIYERTEYPSSFRLLEYWGGVISPDDRGHIAGYAYGWLGLTFGFFGWYGLIWIYIFFLCCFALLKVTGRKLTLKNLTFFAFVASVVYEFLQNFGLDSFGEKIFKGLLYSIIYIFLIKVLFFLLRGDPSQKVSNLHSKY